MGGGDVLGRRIVAAVIDIVIITVLLVLVAKLLGDERNRELSVWAETQGRPRTIFLFLTFLYFWGTEAVMAQTLGKRVMQVRVVGADGSKAPAGAIFGRNLVRIVDWLPGFYLVGFICVLATGERRQRLGDLAAKTRVVRADAPTAAPDEPPPPSDEDVLASILR